MINEIVDEIIYIMIVLEMPEPESEPGMLRPIPGVQV
jgi:hypothetical protein